MSTLRKSLRIALLLVVVAPLGGCVLTKIVTVPMRVVGAVTSIVPVVGNTVDATIDGAADVVDKIPI
jgi:hypothetical protein